MLCEHFGYSVREALYEMYGIEWEQVPERLHWTILEMRAYAKAKAQVDVSRKDKNYRLDITDAVRLVWQIEREIAEERRKSNVES